MNDEKPVPETFETIADKIAALSNAVDARFAHVDVRFSELKAQLGVKIEAVHEDVKRLYDAMIAQHARNETHDTEHKALGKRLNEHDRRLLALERQNRG